MATRAELIKIGSELLRQTDNPRLEAELLLAHILGCDRVKLISWSNEAVISQDEARYQELVSRRLRHEPLAYLVGQKEFWSLSFKVAPGVLIPRPETELLVERLLAKLPQTALTIIELGTGSGAIACALAHERPQWQIIATDVSVDALEIAKENAQYLNLSNITWHQANWFEGLPPQKVAAIISNPPYLSDNDPHLIDDLLHEPRQALVSGPSGLEAYESILAGAPQYLLPGGLVAFEHGYEQGALLRNLFTQAGFSQVASINDLAGLPRVTLGFLG